MHCCSATDSSEIATFVQPRSIAIARQTPTIGRIMRWRSGWKSAGLTAKMGSRQRIVATHERTENATGM
eukprot:3962866-Prymnesium_polylepis.1